MCIRIMDYSYTITKFLMEKAYKYGLPAAFLINNSVNYKTN